MNTELTLYDRKGHLTTHGQRFAETAFSDLDAGKWNECSELEDLALFAGVLVIALVPVLVFLLVVLS